MNQPFLHPTKQLKPFVSFLPTFIDQLLANIFGCLRVVKPFTLLCAVQLLAF